VIVLAPGGVAWAPLALALGPVLAAVAVRQFVAVPMTRTAAPATALAPA
jgi:hypothetical protein